MISTPSTTLLIDRCPSATPVITIAIPTFRRPRFLRESLASASAQDSNLNFEIIVIDNEPDEPWASQVDAVIASCPDQRLRFFRNTSNVGMFMNWNICLVQARGQYISILNDDDLLHPDFLSQSIIHMRNNRIVLAANGYIGSGIRHHRLFGVKTFVRSTLARWMPKQTLRIPDICYGMPAHGTLGMLFPRGLAIQSGGFEPRYFPISDYAFLLNICQTVAFIRLRSTLAWYRIEANESMRVSTLTSFLTRSLLLKLHYVRRLGPGTGAWVSIRQLAAWTASVHASIYREDMNPMFRGHRILRRLGIRQPSLPRHMARLLLPLLWRVVFFSLPRNQLSSGVK